MHKASSHVHPEYQAQIGSVKTQCERPTQMAVGNNVLRCARWQVHLFICSFTVLRVDSLHFIFTVPFVVHTFMSLIFSFSTVFYQHTSNPHLSGFHVLKANSFTASLIRYSTHSACFAALALHDLLSSLAALNTSVLLPAHRSQPPLREGMKLSPLGHDCTICRDGNVANCLLR